MKWTEAQPIVGALEEAAARRRGLVPASAVATAGLGDATVLVRSGRWHPVCRGVYAVVGIEGGPFQEAQARLLGAGPTAFLYGRTAAAALGGLDLDWDGQVHLAVPADGNHRRRTVPPAHVIEVDGLRVTDGLQTLLDLAAVLDDTPWEWALEAALRRGPLVRRHRRPPLTTLAAIEGALVAPGRKDRAAVRRVRRVLAVRPSGAPATDSKLETLFVQLARRFDLPTPSRQVPVRTAGGHVYHVDLAWPELGVFLELDGAGHDGQPEHDAAREADIIAATGWIGVRLRWRQVVHNPTPTARTLARILERAADRALAAGRTASRSGSDS